MGGDVRGSRPFPGAHDRGVGWGAGKLGFSPLSGSRAGSGGSRRGPRSGRLRPAALVLGTDRPGVQPPAPHPHTSQSLLAQADQPARVSWVPADSCPQDLASGAGEPAPTFRTRASEDRLGHPGISCTPRNVSHKHAATHSRSVTHTFAHVATQSPKATHTSERGRPARTGE